MTGEIISLIKSNTYYFTCSAYSNPAVNLSLYNTNTKKSLTTQNNTNSSINCNLHGIGCTTYILVSLDYTQFYNLTSVTCLATSLNSTANLTQKVTVLQTGILKLK